MIGGEFVTPVKSQGDDGLGVEYREVVAEDYPAADSPKGVIELTAYPDGGTDSIIVRRYRIGSSLGGVVFIYLFIPECDLNDSKLLNRAYSTREIPGEGGVEPLFTTK